jgi:hypothetical protein
MKARALALGLLSVVPGLSWSANLTAGSISILATRVVTNGTAQLSGGGMAVTPRAGAPTVGVALSGGGIIVGPPVPAGLQYAWDLSKAHAFPVPFRPSMGHTKITFTNLTRSATVTVYTVNGERVVSLGKFDTTGTMEWSPVANERGERVASGLYLFVVKDGMTGERKTGKLIVIR